MKTYILFPLIIFMLTISSCERIIIDSLTPDKNTEMFEAIWLDIKENYVFFDQKDVDWDKVGATYREQLSEEMSDQALFEVLSGMLSELEDGHVSLYAGFNTWNYYDLYLDYSANYNKDFVERTYLSQINTIGPFTYALLDSSIGYLQYGSFGQDFTEEQLKYLLDYFKDTKSLIIDVRGNLGGAADNITQLMSIFVSEDLTLGKRFTPDHEGLLIEEDIIVHKNEDLEIYSGEIALLTNRQCYSSCNVFAGFMSQLPNVTLIGDTTGGGSGIAVGSELINGWKYRYSVAKITLADYTEMEAGVAPDIGMTTGPEEELLGRDELIEEAKDLFR